MVRKTCEVCNAPLGEVHGNTKYCEYHRIERIRESKRKYEQKRRARLKPPVLSDPDGNKFHAITKTSTALELFDQEIQNRELGKFLRKELTPLFYEVTNRLERLEANQEEMGRVLPIIPNLDKRYPWRERSIRKAMWLVQAFGDSVPQYEMVNFLIDALDTSQRKAIEIMKKAEERLRRMKRDRGQMDLGEWS